MTRALVPALLLVCASAQADEPPVEVIVEGHRSPAGERADPTPAAFVLEGEDLVVPGRSTADTLATAVGAQVTRRGGNSDLATISLRGSTNAQTPIYLAGMRLNDELTGTVDLSTLPLWILHRVEIYRGNAPASVDELGMGGAVLLEPRLPSRGEPVNAQAALGIGSFGERFGRAALSLGDARAGASFSIAHHTATDDYTFVDDGGTRFDERDDVVRRRVNADHRDTDVWAIGRVSQRPVTLALVVSGFDREAGAPGLQLVGAEHSRARRRRWLGGVSATVGTPADRWMLQTDVGVLTSRYRLEDPRAELGYARHVENAGSRHNERVRLTWRPSEALSLTLGGSHTGGRLRLDSDGDSLSRAARDRLRSAFSVLAEPTIGLHISGVAALTHHDTRASNGDRQLLVPAARIGARYRLFDELAVFFNVGRYARVPTLGELYGVAAAVIGSPDLRPEGGSTFEVGAGAEIAGRSVSAYGQLVGHARLADDLIAYRRSSLGVVRPYNIAAARILGIEAIAGASLFRTLTASVSLTALDPRDVSEERETDADLVPLQSRLVVSPRVELSSPPWKLIALDRASAGASLAYRSSRVADPAGLIVLDEQARIDVDAALAFARRVTLRARMQNVAGAQTFDVVGYPLPGRSLHAMLEVGL